MSSYFRTMTSAPSGVYTIDPRSSTVSFVAKSFFGLVRAPGTLSLRAGRIEITNASSAIVAVTLEAETFDTNDPKRDEHIRSDDFLNVARFPTIDYHSTSVTTDGSAVTVYGVLTVKGVTMPVPLTINSAEVGGHTLHVTATASVNRHSFGVTKLRGMIGGTIAVELDITAKMS
jgi:polyisoprenoid-binding protein YceI